MSIEDQLWNVNIKFITDVDYFICLFKSYRFSVPRKIRMSKFTPVYIIDTIGDRVKQSNMLKVIIKWVEEP